MRSDRPVPGAVAAGRDGRRASWGPPPGAAAVTAGRLRPAEPLHEA